MKISGVTYSILSTIFMLSLTALFAAGSLIFIIIQLYNYVFELGGFWVTLPVVILTVLVVFYLFLTLIKNHFFASFERKAPQEHEEDKAINLIKKVATSLIAYELVRLTRKWYHGRMSDHSPKK